MFPVITIGPAHWDRFVSMVFRLLSRHLFLSRALLLGTLKNNRGNNFGLLIKLIKLSGSHFGFSDESKINIDSLCFADCR